MKRHWNQEARGIEYYVQRLVAKGYDNVQTHVRWQNDFHEGEFDIVATRGRYLHYYEFKSTYCVAARERAHHQFERAAHHHPQRRYLKYILVTPTHVERYHPTR